MNVIAPPNGAGVPITVACGPPTSVVPASGVGDLRPRVGGGHASRRREEVLTSALELAPDGL